MYTLHIQKIYYIWLQWTEDSTQLDQAEKIFIIQWMEKWSCANVTTD